MLKQSVNSHLTREEIIKSGSFYTGKELVRLAYGKIYPLINKNSVIGDFGAGYGAFLEEFKGLGRRCFGTECDDLSYELLTTEYSNIDIYHENSLANVNRKKYSLSEKDELVVVGNPPYNDVTSMFKKGKKGFLVCDPDLASRDLGISFLKAYCKLSAKYICVLHPLAYLIKKQNFNALGSFKNSYKLLSGTTFSSKEFEGINRSSADFPVVCALYERNDGGMDYDYIKSFKFEIYKSDSAFILGDILTIDGIVDKYPSKHNNSKLQVNLVGEENQILQFYTLRDMNSLLRNAGFVDGVISNGIDVSLENLYQYAWLYFLKCNFNPSSNKYIYGNLSPLYTEKLNGVLFKNAVVSYAYNNCPVVRRYFDEEQIKALYGSITDRYNALFDELNRLSGLFA